MRDHPEVIGLLIVFVIGVVFYVWKRYKDRDYPTRPRDGDRDVRER